MKRIRQSLRGRPSSGKALSAAERMYRMRQRRKAQGLKSVTQWVVDGLPLTSYSDHRRLDMRSLAMHTLIARKIARNPELLDVARDNLKHWRTRWGQQTPSWHTE